jgi:hypothetical protein
VRILENRLDKALTKFNESLGQNKALRREIDDLRREREVFDGIYRRLERDLSERKRAMAAIIEASNAAYEARDNSQLEVRRPPPPPLLLLLLLRLLPLLLRPIALRRAGGTAGVSCPRRLMRTCMRCSTHTHTHVRSSPTPAPATATTAAAHLARLRPSSRPTGTSRPTLRRA